MYFGTGFWGSVCMLYFSQVNRKYTVFRCLLAFMTLNVGTCVLTSLLFVLVCMHVIFIFIYRPVFHCVVYIRYV